MKTLLILLMSLTPSLLFAKPSQDTTEIFLERFYQNPKAVMAEQPAKTGAFSNKFPVRSLASGDFVSAKDLSRQKICGEECSVDSYIPFAPHNDLEGIRYFVGNNERPLVTNIHAAHDSNLNAGQVTTQPWSDDYWPLYKGATAARYAQPEWYYGSDFTFFHDLFFKNFPPALQTPQDVALLSPAEKYDILVNDPDYTLTKASWEEGQRYQDQFGKVETWMGLCHGWAAASIRVPRPARSVEIELSRAPVNLKFFPSDIKSLATTLWANATVSTHFLGGRCDDKKPELDENGRIISAQCFDANPGAWHISLVNVLGIDKKSFVIDATYDHEVWNQPVVAYQYSYFNPETRKNYSEPEKAIISISDFTNDKFKKYRSNQATHVVGIAMQLTYVVETSPSHREFDNLDYDALTTVRYYYDLELDENGEILGGEWYQNAHPDFLWRPADKAHAVSVADRLMRGSWDGKKDIPRGWESPAAFASQYGQPSSKILDPIVERSKE